MMYAPIDWHYHFVPLPTEQNEIFILLNNETMAWLINILSSLNYTIRFDFSIVITKIDHFMGVFNII